MLTSVEGRQISICKKNLSRLLAPCLSHTEHFRLCLRGCGPQVVTIWDVTANATATSFTAEGQKSNSLSGVGSDRTDEDVSLEHVMVVAAAVS